MGSCLSKKSVCASSSPLVALPDPPEKLKSEPLPEKKKAVEEAVVKKEVFVIKHRKSHEVERQKSDEEKVEVKKAEEIVERGKIGGGSSNGLEGGIGSGGGCGGGGAAVRTSSCTKEEVDAILIQCGRLSRSSSTGKAAVSSEIGGRKYSGSKRSYDFDNEIGKSDGNNVGNGDDDAVARERENRRRERHRQSQGRRRTPSREREKDQAAQQRSGSRERAGSGGGRRVSRSPGRRSESPIPNSGANSNSSAAANAASRPGKMVSVPATVSSLAMDKSSNAAAENNTVKRIQVKRNVGGDGGRTAASPRARSPARVRASIENQNVNSGQNQQPLSLSRSNSRKAENSPFRRNPLGEIDTNIVSQKQNAENKINSKNQNQNQEQVAGHVGLNVIAAGPEIPKTVQTITRSRSSRLSRDLDINPDTLSNPNAPPSYASLLLEDIQNFHQKNTPPPPSFSLPPCVTKACSILEAVADLNSNTGSTDPNLVRKAKPEILESEVVGEDDLMQPSFHKYVTVRRGTSGGEDIEEEQESSGSNSFVGSQQHWLSSSSCWEPNSAESTDRWTSSSRSVSRQKREPDHHQNGIGKGRTGTRDYAAAVASL